MWLHERAAPTTTDLTPDRLMDDYRIGQLLLIFTVVDVGEKDAGGVSPQYTGAIVDLFKHLNRGGPQEPHGMVELVRWPKSVATK